MSRNKFPKGKTKTRSSNIRPAMRREMGSGTPSFFCTYTENIVPAELRLTEVSGGRNIKPDDSDHIRVGGDSHGEIKSKISRSSIIFSALSKRNTDCTSKGTPTSRS